MKVKSLVSGLLAVAVTLILALTFLSYFRADLMGDLGRAWANCLNF